MIRTGEQYRAGLRDGREVWIDGEKVRDVTMHPAFKPIVDAKARMYDMAQEPAHAATMVFERDGEPFSILLRPPTEQAALAREMARAGRLFRRYPGRRHPGRRRDGRRDVVALDGRDVLNEIDPRFGDNIERHIQPRPRERRLSTSPPIPIPRATARSAPQDQDPDMMVHVVKETDAGHRRCAAPSTRPPRLMPIRRS